jgi:cytochrome c peroxidase
MNSRALFALCAFTLLLEGCAKDDLNSAGFIRDSKVGPIPYYLKIPIGFSDYQLDLDKQLTVEGIDIGRHLFYDPILSRNFNTSCASCHEQKNGFSDPRKKSIGTNGEETSFHSMPLTNIAWMDQFFWDGRAPTRESQALQPVNNPHELDMTWQEVAQRLKEHSTYPAKFRAAFGEVEIDSNLVIDALVQFEMTLVSSNSRYDRWIRGELNLTDLEEDGYSIFLNFKQGDCIHCHKPDNVNFADNSFHNNGLDTQEEQLPGLQYVTGRELDRGKFKTPSLRNLIFTAPYMHDGRFETLEDVIEFYSTGVNHYDGVDPKMEFSSQGGVHLDEYQTKAIIAFLKTLSDSSILTNLNFSDPFKN